MKYILSLTCTLLILASACNKFTDEMPSRPEEVEIDINEDDVIDFVIGYRFVDINPLENTGNFGIVGRIDPSNTNQVLTKREESHLFLREINDIKDSVEEPLKWSTMGFSKVLVSITNTANGEWPTKWAISSNSTHSTYFIGLKINSENNTELGWIELEINTSDGSVTIINMGTL